MKKPLSPLVSKSNRLVEAAYKLTLDEQRLLLAVLTKIDSHPDKPAPTDKTRIEITASVISDLLPVSLNKAYGLLKDATDRLAERWVVIDYPDPEEPDLERTRTRWISAIDYLPKRACVRLYLAPKVLPYLTQLSGKFTSYRLQHVAQMTSVYAIRLYELLIQWQCEGEREVEIEWLKKQFMVPDNYKLIGDLRRRVIQPAVDQINEHSNLWVKYSQRKSGRSIVAFQFQFGLKPAGAKTSPKRLSKSKGASKSAASAPEQVPLNLDESTQPPTTTKPAPTRRRPPPVWDETRDRLKGGES